MKNANKNDRPWFNAYAKGVARSLTYEDTPIHEAFRRSVDKYPVNPALIFMGKIIKYRELGELVDRFATALAALGVKRGSRVATLLPNIPQMVIAYYGGLVAGGVIVPNNPLYTDRELEYQLNDSESEYLVTLDLLAPRMIALKPKTNVKKIIVCHINDYLPFPKKQLFPHVKKGMYRKIEPAPDVYEFLDLIKNYKPNPPKIAVRFEDIGTLQYTGGTTGVSKGVVMTHSNLSKNIQQGMAWFPDLSPGEESLVGAIPFFHTFGMTCVMNVSMWMGCSIVLVPRPEPQALLEAIDTYKPTFLHAVPTMYVGMLQHPDFKKYDVSSLKRCFSGAAPLPVGVIRDFESISGAKMCEGYGLSETTPIATLNPYGGKTKVGSIGLPVPDTDMKIVDLETGQKEKEPGQPGEVIIKGPQVTSGYYKKPEETAHAIRDGWLYTGDIGTMDEEGYFYIVDRKKDMIIAGGYNIYPREVDEILFEHPKVAMACTVGVPDEYRGETVKAFIVLKEGQKAEGQEIIDYCKTKLATYKVPKMIEFVDSLPMSAVGKVLRKELRAMEMEKTKKEKK